jgi:hypothetical protein
VVEAAPTRTDRGCGGQQGPAAAASHTCRAASFPDALPVAGRCGWALLPPTAAVRSSVGNHQRKATSLKPNASGTPPTFSPSRHGGCNEMHLEAG